MATTDERRDEKWIAHRTLAIAALRRRDFVAADQEYEAALRISGEESLGDAYVVESLEGLYAARKWSADASTLQVRAAQLRWKLLSELREELRDDHPDVADAYQACAHQAHLSNDMPSANELFQRALDIRIKTVGEHSWIVGNTLTVMAGMNSMAGDRSLASDLAERAASIFERLYETRNGLSAEEREHVSISLKGNLENLAVHSFLRNDFALAEQHFRRAIEVIEQSFPKGSQLCNTPTFVRVLIRQQKLDEAEQALSDAMQFASACSSRYREWLTEVQEELLAAKLAMKSAQ